MGKPRRKGGRQRDRLSPQQQRFVAEYLVDFNGRQAAIRAGYSARSAEVTASKLLRLSKVAEAVQGAIEKRLQRVEVRQDEVLRELLRIATSDIRRLFDERGNLKRLNALSDDAAAAVSSVEVVTKSIGDGEVEYIHKIRLWPKTDALGMLGRHLGMFTDKVDVNARVRAEPLTDEEINALTDEELEQARRIAAKILEQRKRG